MNTKKIILSLILIYALNAEALFASEKLSSDTVFRNINTYLIENSGQYPSEILYSSYPANVSILKDRIVVQGVEIIFKETDKNVKVKPSSKQAAAFNYFMGSDQSKWRSNVASYENVIFENIYKNMDLNFTGIKNGGIEFQWMIKPYADLSKIVFEINGAEVKNLGNKLEIIRENKILFTIDNLKAYQGTEEREVSFNTIKATENGVEFGYLVNDYNPECMLVIDPDLSNLLASTYLGGSSFEYGQSLAIDASGNVFVTGGTFSSDFPIVSGYDSSFNGTISSADCFVAKFDNTLSLLLSTTFVGGNGSDYGFSLAFDSLGNVFLAGRTTSSDFPIAGGYDNTFNGGYDVFVAKFDNTLNTLLASTYLGGDDDDLVYSLALDFSKNVFVAGYTRSSDFPIGGGHSNAYSGGSYDVFVAKFDNTLNSLLASTYLGGDSSDYCFSLALDVSGNIFVSGSTISSDFPIAGGYDNTFNGNYDVFVAKFDNTLNTLLASTFLGGSSNDQSGYLALDASENVFVTGNIYSSDFPIEGGYDSTFNGNNDVFVAKFDNTLSSLLASTFLGGSGSDYANSLALDTSGNIFVTGKTLSSDFSIIGGYNNTYNSSGASDVFVAKFDKTLNSLLASTYLGGNLDDHGFFLALDASGNVFVTGETYSSDFPIIGGYDNTFNGGNYDAFIAKFDNQISAIHENKSIVKNKFTFNGNSINFNILKSSYIGVDIYKPDGALAKSISYGFVNTGNYEINLADLNSGAYIANVRMGAEVKGEKIVIIK